MTFTTATNAELQSPNRVLISTLTLTLPELPTLPSASAAAAAAAVSASGANVLCPRCSSSRMPNSFLPGLLALAVATALPSARTSI